MKVLSLRRLAIAVSTSFRVGGKRHARRHRLSFPEESPLAMVAPSGLTAQQLTPQVCPFSVFMHALIAASQLQARVIAAREHEVAMDRAERTSKHFVGVAGQRATAVVASHSFNVLSQLPLRIEPSEGLK